MRTPSRELILSRDKTLISPGLPCVDILSTIYSPGKDTPKYFKQNWLEDTGGPL